MIGDLFGNINEQQEQLKQQLEQIEITETSQNQEVTITISGAKNLRDISIDPEKIDANDLQQLEDLLLITLNNAMDKAEKLAAEETQKLIQDMLPPGLGNMFG